VFGLNELHLDPEQEGLEDLEVKEDEESLFEAAEKAEVLREASREASGVAPEVAAEVAEIEEEDSNIRFLTESIDYLVVRVFPD